MLHRNILIEKFYKNIGYGMERVKGIEPSSPAWKADALPLSYTRINVLALYSAIKQETN